MDQNIHDSVRWQERVYRLGKRVSAGISGGLEKGSIWRRPQVSDPQTTQPHLGSEVQGAQALPVTEVFDESRPQSVSPVHREELEWDDLQLGNEPFTPDNYHVNLARQLAEGQGTEAPFVSNFARKLA